jgi:hypothetical protein
MVVRRRLAASGEVSVTGVVVGWVSDRLVVCGLVVGSVVVAVGIGSQGRSNNWSYSGDSEERLVNRLFRGQLGDGHTAFGAAKGLRLQRIGRPLSVTRLWNCR